MNGWLKLHRKLLDSKQFTNPLDLKIWIWLLCKASTQDRHITLKVGSGHHSVALKKGQIIFGRSSAERELNIDGSTVYKIIQRLQENKDILIQSNNHFSIITVTNYVDYQNGESIADFEIIEDVAAKEQPDSSNVAATEQQRSSNVTQYKKVNKVYKVEKVEKVGAGAQPIFVSEDFKRFLEWIEINAWSVGQMKEPFTENQFLEIQKIHSEKEITEVLQNMHNYQPLLRKNKSAYLTAKKWLKPKENGNPNNFKTITPASNGTSVDRIEAAKRW